MPTTVKLGSTGSDVALLQRKLNILGSKLTVDGDFGAKTNDAVIAFQHTHGLVVDGVVGPKTWTALDEAIAALDPANHPPVTTPPNFYDRRKYAAQSHGGHAVFDRPIAQVTGACAHQTACNFGERIERYDTVGAHFAITRAGKIIWLHDFTHQVAAANGWNDGTVSIEVDGLYAGVEGEPATVWDDPSTPGKETGMALTHETAEALKALLRWIKQQLGPQMNAIVAHRQASENRRNDPGSAIWAVVLAMHGELGCSDGGVGFTLGDGLPIPEKWDPRCVGIAY